MKSKAKKILKSLSVKCTKPRLEILTALLNAKSPLSKEDISLSINNARINKTTIYRNLEMLIELGVVHRAYLNERKWYYELSHNCEENQCHPHFTCTNCGNTSCFSGDFFLKVIDKDGFEIHHQSVHLKGLCPSCSK